MDRVNNVSSMVMALEQATLMAKQLPATSDPSQTYQIYSSLHAANLHLSSFLSSSIFHQPPRSSSFPIPAVADPMQLGEGDNDGENKKNPKVTIDHVEERMRECFIQNKRPKRTLSPSAAVTAEQLYDIEFNKVGSSGFDSHTNRLRSLELIYQFHG